MISSSSNPHTDLVPASLQVLTTLLLVDPGTAIPWSPACNRGLVLIDPSILSQCRQPRTLGFLPHSLPASSHEVQKMPTSRPLHMLFPLSGTLFPYASLLMDSSSVCRLWLGCQWDTSCPVGPVPWCIHSAYSIPCTAVLLLLPSGSVPHSQSTALGKEMIFLLKDCPKVK